MEATARYRIAATTASDGHILTAYDTTGRPHAALTEFARIVSEAGQPAAARAYTYALLAFFAFLDADPVQRAAGRRWDARPGDVRAAIRAYVAHHPAGRDFFLAALHRFYRVQCDAGAYHHANPLAEPLEAAPDPADPTDATGGLPREADAAVADPLLHSRLVLAGRRVGWGLRERCVARVALESGAGLEVVLGLTLGDWLDRGMGRELVARAVGRDRRMRVLRVAPVTARLLHQYGETARKVADPDGLGLAEHRRLAATGQDDPDGVPLFLTARGTPLRPATFRDRSWHPACAAAGLTLEPRDARSWYAAQATRLIRETCTGSAVAIALRHLAAYLRGAGGTGAPEDLLARAVAATAAHARDQDRFHSRLGDDLGRALADALRAAA
jgi:hypothetical protein